MLNQKLSRRTSPMHLGYTLIELLTVVTLLTVIVVAITELLGASLSGAGKANALRVIKENGDFALSFMERTAKRATQLVDCSTGTLSVIVPEQIAGTTVDTTYTFQQSGTKLTMTVDPPATTSDLTTSDVTVTGFSCIQAASSPGNPEIVRLVLTLQRQTQTVLPKEQVATQTFETSLTLRSY